MSSCARLVSPLNKMQSACIRSHGAIAFSLSVRVETVALAFYLPNSNDEALEGLLLPAATFVILGKAAHFVKIYGQVTRA